jgi:hypothetical protein
MEEQTNIPGPINTPTKYPTRRYNTRHRKRQIAEFEKYSTTPDHKGDARESPEYYQIDDIEEIHLRRRSVLSWTWAITKFILKAAFFTCSVLSMCLCIYVYIYPEEIKLILSDVTEESDSIFLYIDKFLELFWDYWEQARSELDERFPNFKIPEIRDLDLEKFWPDWLGTVGTTEPESVE